MLFEGFFVSVFGLEILPFLPHTFSIIFWICELADVGINGPGSFNLAHFYLNVSIFLANLHDLFLVELLKSGIKNCPCLCYSQKLAHLCNVNVEGLVSFIFQDIVDHTIIYFDCVRVKAMLLFELGIHEIKNAGFFFWNFL